MQTPDQRAAATAARQFGAVTRRQALDCGLTPSQIEWRLRTGRWRRAAYEVYVVVGVPETWQLSAMVAVLAGPPGTVASHLTAAALFGLWTPPAPPHVTVPRGTNGRYRGAVVHWSSLDALDRCVAARIPCTHPARMLVDCAAVLGERALCDLVDQTLFRFTDAPGVQRAMVRASRAPGRKGQRNLQHALEVWTPGPKPGSPAEMRLVRHLQRLGFPLPERQWKVRDEGGRFVGRIDLAWPDLKVGLEYDGEEHHGPRRWRQDDDRQDCLEALGWQMLRVGKSDLGPGSTRVERWLAPRVGRRSAA
ncbi:MAG: type IV toxin-antitoxin system AbiEi family antitoxin domain-containing protein [Acidimicrobiia bacterium]